MGFERWTERARQVVVLAQEEARNLKHGYAGTEHLLLGLLREEEGLAARILESLDITVERTRAQVVKIVGEGRDESAQPIPFTPRVSKVFDLALREALSLGHNYIGTEHILLGLIRENEGIGTRILLYFNADAEKIRNEVIRMLSGPGSRAPTLSPLDKAIREADGLRGENEDLRAEIVGLKLHAKALADELTDAWWVRAGDHLRALTRLADDDG
jgi:ATP-dependent Clp protease ATP-binding subunit ClpC